MRRSRLRPQVAFDNNSLREAFSGPGMDTRTWVSMGLVGFNDGEPIIFDTDRKVPLVKVTLHPSFTKVYCRVAVGASGAAGDGEGEWAPFVENDEVLVLLPEGNEKAGAVITNRFNNQLYKFPMDSVAGQDPTTNTFGFVRRRTPFITEVAGPWMVRSALSGAFINISKEGIITLKDGENSAFQISPDVIGLVGPSTESTAPEFVMQLDLTGRHFVLQVGDAIMTLSASDASPETNLLAVPGSFSLGTIGNPPIEHVVTTEAVANIISNAFTTFAALVAPVVIPLTGSALSTAIVTWLTSPAYAATFSTSMGTPLTPLVAAAIFSAFGSAGPKPPATLFGQVAPGIGAPGFTTG
jgi:hypothetical protein